MINAGTIAAYLTLDTQPFQSAVRGVRSQLSALSDESIGFAGKMTAVGGALTTAGTAMTKYVSVPVATVLTAAGKAAIDFEDAFAGVRKTVDATEEEYDKFAKSILDMAGTMPTAAEEIAGVMESAGQLGIGKAYLEEFTKTMVKLGDTTNLSANEAATTLARFANIVQMNQQDFGRLGSTIVALGNNFATTEAEISDMALRLAGAGRQIGMTEAEILAIATALSSVGIESEAGGSAMSKVMSEMALAVEKGASASNESLANFARVAGMTSSEFAKAFKEDAASALTAFISGLGALEENGGSAIAVLDAMNITEVRMRDALLRASGASEMFADAIDMANSAWKENSALSAEAEKRYETTASQLKILWNDVKTLGISFGEFLLPTVKDFVSKAGELVKWLNSLDSSTKKMIVNAGMIAAATGPVISGLGKTVTSIGNIVSAGQKLHGIIAGAGGLSKILGNLGSKILPLLGSTGGLAVGVFGALAVGAWAVWNKIKPLEEGMNALAASFSGVFEGAAQFVAGIDSASGALSHLDDKSISGIDTDSVTAQISAIQAKITAITNLASSERRSLTQKEIDKINEYFRQMDELTNKMYEAKAARLATLSAIILEEENMTSERAQSYLAEAQTLKEETVSLAEDTYAQRLAILRQQYTTEEAWNSEACQSAIASAAAERDGRINAAKEQYAGVTSTISDMYAAQTVQNSDWFAKLSQYNSDVEAENKRHSDNMHSIENGYYTSSLNRMFDDLNERQRHNQTMDALHRTAADNFDAVAAQETATWLGMIATAEANGGALSEEYRSALDSIIAVFGTLPEESKESMRNTWLGMKGELEAGDAELYAAAEANADSVINAIDTALGIASPSRVMMERGRFTIAGLVQGMNSQRGGLSACATGMVSLITGGMKNISLSSVGSDAIKGLIGGMNAKVPSLYSTASTIASNVVSRLKKALRIASPSKETQEIGAYVGEGLVLGMRMMQRQVEEQSHALALAAVPQVSASDTGTMHGTARATGIKGLDTVIELLETIAAQSTSIELDGRTFGRIVKEYS